MNTHREIKRQYYVRDNAWHQVFGPMKNIDQALLKSEMIDAVHGGVHVTEIIKAYNKPSIIGSKH